MLPGESKIVCSIYPCEDHEEYKINETTRLKLNKLTNPKYVGPGVWWSMSVLTHNVDSNYANKNMVLSDREWNLLVNERTRVSEYIKSFCRYFGCDECKRHFKQYIRDHPIPILGYYMEMNHWVTRFHNSVNSRTSINGSPDIYRFRDVEEFYGNRRKGIPIEANSDGKNGVCVNCRKR